MIILKLGGSILTKKDSSASEIDEDNLHRLACEIRRSLNNDEKDLVIVHGAGSFGHPPAKEYKIGEPFEMDEYPYKRIGFAKIQNSVKKLNMLVCEELIKEDIPAVAIPASSFVTSSNKRISKANLDNFRQYLEKGYVPVIYGDVVLDDDLEMAVISGDQIIQYLAVNLNADNVILGTDVDGVYNKNPKLHDDAQLYERFSSLDELESFEGSVNVDVTGGMVGKIKELLDLADLGINSIIINANVEDNIYNALEQENVTGTIISKELNET